MPRRVIFQQLLETKIRLQAGFKGSFGCWKLCAHPSCHRTQTRDDLAHNGTDLGLPPHQKKSCALVIEQWDKQLTPSQAALLLCRWSSVCSPSPNSLAAITAVCCENGLSCFYPRCGEAAGCWDGAGRWASCHCVTPLKKWEHIIVKTALYNRVSFLVFKRQYGAPSEHYKPIITKIHMCIYIYIFKKQRVYILRACLYCLQAILCISPNTLCWRWCALIVFNSWSAVSGTSVRSYLTGGRAGLVPTQPPSTI